MDLTDVIYMIFIVSIFAASWFAAAAYILNKTLNISIKDE